MQALAEGQLLTVATQAAITWNKKSVSFYDGEDTLSFKDRAGLLFFGEHVIFISSTIIRSTEPAAMIVLSRLGIVILSEPCLASVNEK